jgi:hypothetical protein
MALEREDEFAELFDNRCRLFTPTLTAEWERPERVELLSPPATLVSLRTILEYPTRADIPSLDAQLKIYNRVREPIADLKASHLVRAHPNLLERFLQLAETSDVKLQKFAERYGGLEIFYAAGDAKGCHIEYCDVWRYFALGMQALLRIGAALHTGKRTAMVDWGLIGGYPKVMDEVADKSGESDPLRFPISHQEAWLSMARYIHMREQPYAGEARRMFTRLVNTLLGLGNVRPWIVWPSGQGRPQLRDSGRSLLSVLALQLCLRAARIDAFVLCTHCQRQYLPPERAPKAGQRNFCPECRQKGVPQQYALRDFRRKQRQEISI